MPAHRTTVTARSTARSRRLLSIVAVVVLGGSAVAGCSGETGSEPDEPTATKPVVRVPEDAKTVQAAIDQVAENGLVLIGPGTYHESVQLKTRGVTIRGLDRNRVVFDGEGTKSNGIVATAEGVSIENLTVTSYLLNGVIVTGVTDKDGNGIGRGSAGYQPIDPADFPLKAGFAIRSVTATNNGLYGLYSLNRKDGVIEDNYASGSADSGIYVGQCDPCNIVVRNNVTQNAAVGIETANASAPMYIVGNRTTDNRFGMLIMSNYQETYIPSKGIVIAGNYIADNANEATPEQATGGFGTGIALSATVKTRVEKNTITGHPNHGVMLVSESDLAPTDNVIGVNDWSQNGVDVAYGASQAAPGTGNCVTGRVSSFPSPLPPGMQCPAKPGTADPAAANGAPLAVAAPSGISFLDVALPADQPGLQGDPATLPHTPAAGVPQPELSTIKPPSADLLADRAR